MFSYENQGGRSYLVYTLENGETIDTMSLGMITNNQITGLIPALFTQTDSAKTIKYNVSSRIPIKQVLSGGITKARLLGAFNGIADALLACEDYMIDPATLVFDLDYIFTDVSEYKTELVCVPTSGITNSAQSPSTLLKLVMSSYTFDTSENSAYVTRIINFLNSSTNFSAAAFKKMLQEINADGNPPHPVPQPPTAPPAGYPLEGPPPAPPILGLDHPIGDVERPPRPDGPGHHPGPVVPPKAPSPQDADKTSDKGKMSFLYLLQHFSSGNLAIYKAQKGDEVGDNGENKGNKGGKNSANKGVNKDVKSGGKNGGNKGSNASLEFAVPGQSERPAVPPASGGGWANQPQHEKPPMVPGFQDHLPKGEKPISGTIFLDDDSGKGGSGTVFFPGGEDPALKPTLVRKKNDERIPVNKPVFCLGSQVGYADYCISGNRFISRSHANIISRNGEYFVVDTNSLNHTFVNGEMIQSNMEVKLSHGTAIRLGNEEFEFLLW